MQTKTMNDVAKKFSGILRSSNSVIWKYCLFKFTENLSAYKLYKCIIVNLNMSSEFVLIRCTLWHTNERKVPILFNNFEYNINTVEPVSLNFFWLIYLMYTSSESIQTEQSHWGRCLVWTGWTGIHQ